MKVCIVSDSHDHRPLLAAAVQAAKQAGAEAVLHCGDVVAPSTLSCLKKHNLPVHVIHGNNTGDLYALGRLTNRPESIFHYYCQSRRLATLLRTMGSALCDRFRVEFMKRYREMVLDLALDRSDVKDSNVFEFVNNVTEGEWCDSNNNFASVSLLLARYFKKEASKRGSL